VDFSQKAGKAVAEKIECEGAIALSQSGLSEGENRVIENFKIGYLEVCSDAKFLEVTIVGSNDMAKSIVLSSGALQANPDITAAFSSTSDGAPAWALAAEESGIEKGKIAIVGMDGTRANLDLVASGKIWMLVGQPVFEEAYYDVVLLVNHLMGYPVPFENLLPAPQITLENVDQFYAIVEKAEAVEIK
jgi:ribose transport system substrate-binding protein